MKKTVTCLAIILLFTGFVHAQTRDSLIYAEGTIVNAANKEPVKAKILYQSLPYGSKVGLLSGSSFSFPLFDKEKYSITVEAPGFSASKYILDPATANGDGKVIQNIELGVPKSAAEEAETTHHVGKVMRLDALIFEVGKAKITPSSYPELDQVVKMLQDNPRMVIQLEGHTDSKGDPKKNRKLSEERVEAVRDYLVNKGVTRTKVKTKAFGGTMPLTHEDTEAAHKLNRRVEVRVLQN